MRLGVIFKDTYIQNTGHWNIGNPYLKRRVSMLKLMSDFHSFTVHFHSCTVHFDLYSLLLLQPMHNKFALKH